MEDTVQEYDQKNEASDDTRVRKKLRSERKEPKQYRKQFKDFLRRKEKYRKDMGIFGARNSYSKTDHDATFMRMKEDHMQNGQLKAGYNVQVATEGQYALAYDLYPNPTDTRTLIPFLDRIEQDFFDLPSHIVADVGYGSKQNYGDILENRERVPLITYNQHRKEQKKKWKEDPFNTANWAYDEQNDVYTCPNGRKLGFSHFAKWTDKYEFTRHYKIYECEDCSDRPCVPAVQKRPKGTIAN